MRILPTLVVILSLGFAPAPVYRYRPLSPREQQALLNSVEEEMRLAAEGLDAGRTDAAGFARKNRAAGERLDRLHRELPDSGALRARVGLKAAIAWKRAGELKKSLGYYEDVAERASDLDARLEGLIGARGCYARLGKRDEAAKAEARVTGEVARLGPTEKKLWELELVPVGGRRRLPESCQLCRRSVQAET